MQGSLKQRSKGSWTIRLDVGLDPTTGRRRQRMFTLRGTRKQAQERLRELLHEIDTGMPMLRTKLTVGAYLKDWLRDVVAIRNRPRTAEAYAVIINNHLAPNIGSIPLTRLQPGHVEKMEAKLLASGLSRNTVLHVHRIVSKAMKDALRKGMVQRNVCTMVEPPAIGHYEVNPPSAEQVARILGLATATPYEAAYRFMAMTGCRRGECLGLMWEHVDLENAVASIVQSLQRLQSKGLTFQPPKSEAGRRGIALDPSTVERLRSHRGQQLLHKLSLEGAYEDHNLVFPGPLGRPLDPSVLTRNFEKLARKAGLPGLRLHDLRHAHASGLIRTNVHPRVVQDRLGHASAAFTMQVYGHVAAGLQEEAAKSFVELMNKASGKGS